MSMLSPEVLNKVFMAEALFPSIYEAHGTERTNLGYGFALKTA